MGEMTCVNQGIRLDPGHDELLASSPSQSVFMTADWLDTWFTCFGSQHDVLNLAVRRKSELIGVAPLVVATSRSNVGLRRAVVAGQSPTTGEHLDLIAAPGEEGVVAESIAKSMTQALWRKWDVLTVQRVLADSESMRAFVAALNRYGCRTEVIPSGSSPYADLPNDQAGLLEGKSKNFRSQVRQSRNRVDRLGDVTIERVGGGLDLDAGFDELVRLHRVRWADESSFDTDEKVAFHRLLSRRFAEKGRLFLSLLKVDGKTIAARYDFVYEQKIWCIQGGWDPSYSAARPGMVLTEDVLKWGIGRGLREYDFLAGDADYKARWSTGERALVTVIAANPSTARGRVYGLRMARQYAQSASTVSQ